MLDKEKIGISGKLRFGKHHNIQRLDKSSAHNWGHRGHG